MPQDKTEQMLEERVARFGVSVERNTELVGLSAHDVGVTARLRRDGGIEEFPAGWVLGCDGAHSKVREELGVSFEGATYPERFALADIMIDGAFEHEEAKVWLPAEGAVALFPLPQRRWRLILADAPDDWPPEPGLAQCQALLDARLPARLQLADPRWISLFRIHRRIAGHFRRGRAFLLGDAGHIHSPVGGQGMNMGIQDAFNLVWKLALVVANRTSPALLDSYEAERRPIDEAVVRQTDRGTRLISLHGAVPRFLRDHLLSLASRLPPVAERFGEAIAGLAGNYRDSPTVEDAAAVAAGPHAGERAPDVALDDADGMPTALYRLVAEHRHLLLIVGDAGPAPPLPHDLTRYPIVVRRIAAAGAASGDLVDCAGEAVARYGSAPLAYLIRPDGYVGFRCRRDQLAERLPRYLTRVLAPG